MRGSLGGGNDGKRTTGAWKQAPAKLEIYRNGLSFALNVWRQVTRKSPHQHISGAVPGVQRGV